MFGAHVRHCKENRMTAMTLSNVSRAITTSAVLALCAAFVFAPARAQDQTTTGGAPTLCSIVWDGQTSGGDTQTAHGELQFTRSVPQANGGFIMFGSGQATVIYHSGAGLTITSGSPFTAKLEVILTSDDGRTAHISIDTATDEPDHEIVADPGGFTFSTDAEMPPKVTMPLQDGASVPYSESLGSGIRLHGKSGTFTLRYCPSSAH
jgi:hypothetical protein